MVKNFMHWNVAPDALHGWTAGLTAVSFQLDLSAFPFQFNLVPSGFQVQACLYSYVFFLTFQFSLMM